MARRRRIIANEALFYASDRLSPGVGAIHLYRGHHPLRSMVGWMRWWHWAGLAMAALLVIDGRLS